MAHVHSVPQRRAGGRQLQWLVLRHRAALPHAPLCHHVHRCLSLEDEPNAGSHDVCTVFCVPRPQRPPGGSHPCLSSFNLRERTLLHLT